MSPLPINLRAERLALALSPGRVGMVRLRGWPRARIVDRLALPTAGTTWQDAIEALDAWLEDAGVRRATADVVLSNRYARFAWLPWSGDLSMEEQAALALARFRDQYGDMDGWTVNADPGSYGRPTLASAVEQTLIADLKRIFERRGIACRRLQPYFVAGWNRWRDGIGTGDALFAVAESGTIVVGALAGEGRQRHWRGLRAMLGDAGTLPALLAREGLLHGYAQMPSCHVLVPGLADTTLPAPLNRLVPEPNDADAAVAMALCGAGR